MAHQLFLAHGSLEEETCQVSCEGKRDICICEQERKIGTKGGYLLQDKVVKEGRAMAFLKQDN
jgi:hypothetical protein